MRHLTTYLAGAMQGATQEEARRWRIDLTNRLKEIKIDTFDPTDPEFQKANFSYDSEKLANDPNTVRSFENIDFVKAVRQLAYIDLQAVNKCEFVTLYWTPACMKGAGSYGEATLAFWLHKPLLTLVDPHDVELVPGWIKGITSKVFYDIDTYLRYVQANFPPEREYYVMPTSGDDPNLPIIMRKGKNDGWGWGKVVDFEDTNFKEALAEALEIEDDEEEFSQAYANYVSAWHKHQRWLADWNARCAWEEEHKGDFTGEIPFPSSLDLRM